jgi:hypothetical protein
MLGWHGKDDRPPSEPMRDPASAAASNSRGSTSLGSSVSRIASSSSMSTFWTPLTSRQRSAMPSR